MIKNFFHCLKDIVFPPLCFACTRKTHLPILCDSCFKTIDFLRGPLCLYCAGPLQSFKQDICKHCAKKSFAFDKLISITKYQEPIVSLIHLFKYSHYGYLADFFARIMTDHAANMGLDFSAYEIITEVPAHKYKLKDRGYNQSRLLAQSLAKHFGIAHRSDIIGALLYRPSQTKLSPEKRQLNVSEAFVGLAELKEKNVLLIDDIYTTGSTIDACSKALKAKGAKTITVVTLAKA